MRDATSEDDDAAEKAMFLNEDGEDKRMVEEEVLERNWFNIFKKWFTDVCWLTLKLERHVLTSHSVSLWAHS